jgi:hypothetical protein
MWLSVDPALEEYLPKPPNSDEAKEHNKKLPGMGGAFNTVNLNLYHYAGNNPVVMSDPDGREVVGAIAGAVFGAASDLALQVAGNLLAGESAFHDIKAGSIALSAGMGAVAGGVGLGLGTQAKKGYQAFKELNKARNALKLRNEALTAGKVRNATKTAKVQQKLDKAKKELGGAIKRSIAVSTTKNLIKQGYNTEKKVRHR